MACARIEDLAKAAKRAGHPGRVGHLRADPPCSAGPVTRARFPAGERSVLTSPALWPPRRAAPRGASPSRMRPHLAFAGMTRRRPHAGGIQSAPRRGGVVELHVSESLLTVLAADPAGCGEWAGIIADIVPQNLHRTPARKIPPHGSPARRCADTSSCATDPACSWDAGARPVAPTWTIPSTTPDRAPRTTPIRDRSAGTTIASNTSAGGGCPNPNPATSSGSAPRGDLPHAAAADHRRPP